MILRETPFAIRILHFLYLANKQHLVCLFSGTRRWWEGWNYWYRRGWRNSDKDCITTEDLQETGWPVQKIHHARWVCPHWVIHINNVWSCSCGMWWGDMVASSLVLVSNILMCCLCKRSNTPCYKICCKNAKNCQSRFLHDSNVTTPCLQLWRNASARIHEFVWGRLT